MKIDPDSVAAILTTISEMPVRMLAMEQAVTELTSKIEALREASPPLLVKRRQVPAVKVPNTMRVDLSRVRGVDAEDIARMAREAVV
jgi:hypothetical protein